MQGDAIHNEDGVHIVRVLTIQANVCCSSFVTVGSNTGGGSGKNIGNMNVNEMSGSGGSAGGTSSTISSIGSSIMSGFGMLSGSSSSASNSGGSNNTTNHHHNHDQNSHSSSKSSSTNHSSSSKSSTISNIIGKSSGGYSSSTGKTGRSLKEDEALSIRILQTLTMIIDSRTLKLSEDLLCQCLAICFTFISATSEGGGSISSMLGIDDITSSHLHNGKNMMSSGSSLMMMDYEKKRSSSSGVVGGGVDKSSNSSVSISAKKVKRAAIATLRQIISIVFDRAATDTPILKTPAPSSSSSPKSSNEATTANNNNNNNKTTGENSEKSTSLIASSLFLDLCDLAEFGSGIHATKKNIHNLESQLKEKGPFSQALLGGGIGHQRMDPPPRSVCFDLLEMIISQQVELFTKIQEKKEDEDNDDDGDGEPDFAALLRKRLCPVLSNMLASEFVTGLETTDSNDEIDKGSKKNNTGRRRHPDSPRKRMVGDNPASFTLLMTLTKLAATIITVYGTRSALASSLHPECHVLLVSLVKYIKAATEVIRDCHEFEDGFVYSSNAKEEIQQAMKSHGYKHEVLPCASSHVLWRAAITLELLYGLISDSFQDLLPLLKSGNGSRPSDTLLSVLVEAIADFAVVISSNKIGIVSIVNASAIKEDGKDASNNDSFDELNGPLVPLRDYVFDTRRIQPLITSKARDIVKVSKGMN